MGASVVHVVHLVYGGTHVHHDRGADAMTISLGLLVLISVALMHKMKGVQWPALFLGMLLHATAPTGGLIDQATDQGVVVFQSVVDQVTVTADEIF